MPSGAFFFYCDSVNTSYFSFSNITDNPINVTVTLYNSDGTLLTDDGSNSSGILKELLVGGTYKFFNYSDKNSDSSATFTINAHSTEILSIGNKSYQTAGYGMVQWTQNNSTVLQGMISTGEVQIQTNGAFDRQYTTVNNGLPF